MPYGFDAGLHRNLRALKAELSGQQAEHVAAYEREMQNRADQWALSNGMSVVAECGTILEGAE